MYQVLAILGFSHWQFLTNFEVKIFTYIVHQMCRPIFHCFRIFSISFDFSGVKRYGAGGWAPECCMEGPCALHNLHKLHNLILRH